MPDVTVDYDPHEKRDAIEAIVKRYEESDRWDRKTAIDALRYVKAKYTLGLDEEQIVRGYRNYENVQYCPFCGSEDIEFHGWYEHDDDPHRPDDKLFDCDNCNGFHIHGDVTGVERRVRLPKPLRESPRQEYTPAAIDW